jgi:hypothetical protein
VVGTGRIGGVLRSNRDVCVAAEHRVDLCCAILWWILIKEVVDVESDGQILEGALHMKIIFDQKIDDVESTDMGLAGRDAHRGERL